MSYQEVTRDQLLASVNRRVLDFDFEAQCSVTLSTKNIYVCLICGKNFQGRAFNSPMHVHAVNTEHRLFMSIADGNCVVMPDNMDIEMPELDDIRRALFMTEDSQNTLEDGTSTKVDVHGKEYICGFVGLNNPRRTHINVVLQVMTHITPLKHHYLKNIPVITNKVETAFAEVMKRVWSPHLLKACISPHSFIQVSEGVSEKPFEFIAWFLNNLPKRIIVPIFQGQILINSQTSEQLSTLQRTKRPFYMLTLDLPPLPLFQDIVSRRTVPQIGIDSLLKKYSANEVTFKGTTATSYELVNLPNYLILNIPRITRSDYNNTVVIYPDIISLPHPLLHPRYTLIASICVLVDTSIDAIANTKSTYTYTAFILDERTNKWWEMRDAEVKQLVSAEIVRMADTCLQIWKRIE